MTEAQGHRWAVIGQEEHPVIDPEGNPTIEHTTRFKTAHGHESSVTHLEHQYSARNVHAAIEHKARELMKVHDMHSESKPSEPGAE